MLEGESKGWMGPQGWDAPGRAGFAAMTPSLSANTAGLALNADGIPG